VFRTARARTRPTPGRVKEALFSILGARIVDARVLDLFAGSGALGFEALSRGAAQVTFVERHRPTAGALRGAARELGVEATGRGDRRAGRARRCTTSPAATTSSSPIRPTRSRIRRRASRAARAAAPSTRTPLVVYEHSARRPPADALICRPSATARYGEVALAFLQPLEA
jgi:16S rRNA (guanine966-N2)-methyltransferase